MEFCQEASGLSADDGQLFPGKQGFLQHRSGCQADTGGIFTGLPAGAGSASLFRCPGDQGRFVNGYLLHLLQQALGLAEYLCGHLQPHLHNAGLSPPLWGCPGQGQPYPHRRAESQSRQGIQVQHTAKAAYGHKNHSGRKDPDTLGKPGKKPHRKAQSHNRSHRYLGDPGKIQSKTCQSRCRESTRGRQGPGQQATCIYVGKQGDLPQS